MKLIRFLAEDGSVLYGRWDERRPQEACIIRGNLFGEYQVTDERTEVKQILAPVIPPNVLAVGLNYRGHAEETELAIPADPVLFMKATTSIIGPGAAILLPLAGSHRVDYEAELAIIIGKKGKNIALSDAMGHVFGYTCSNDVSARDWQMERQSKQWVRGKSFDTFCPLGPVLVTGDEIPDPGKLRIQAIVNGTILQDGNTAQMIFDVAALISALSRSLTLLPGTVIMTGTPEGVGFTRQPPVYLHDGDVVTVDIEGIGQLTNPIKNEVAP